MCNKYKEFSKVDEYEKKDIVDKFNMINFDFAGKVKHIQCLTCKNACPDTTMKLNNDGTCKLYSERMTLSEINKEIKTQNINIRKLCKENNLKYGKMKDALKGKRILTYKYYVALENRINEKEEYLDYMEYTGGIDGK